MQKLLLAFAIVLGLFFAYVGSRPNWDDIGLLVFSIAIVSAILGFVGPQRPWIWALTVGGFYPLYSIVHSASFPPLVVLAFAFAGAYFGAGVRKFAAPAAEN